MIRLGAAGRMGRVIIEAIRESGGVRPGSALLAQLLKNKKGMRRYIGPKRIVLLALFIIGVALVWEMRRRGYITPELVLGFVKDRPLLAPAAFVLVYAVAVVGLLPTLPFNLAAGFFWGPIGGGLAATVGTWLGANVAFAVARLLFGQPLAVRFDNRVLARIRDEYERLGWRFIAFVRVNPVFPTSPLNYLLGFTTVTFTTYCWATFLFLLPPSTIVAWIGSEMGSLVTDGDAHDRVMALIAISFAICLLVVLRYGAKIIKWMREDA